MSLCPGEEKTQRLVAVVRGLVGTVDGDVKVLGLLVSERCELDVELLEVSTCDLLIELLGKHVHADRELARVGPERDLSQNLVGERARHDEGGVTSGTAASTRVNKQQSVNYEEAYPKLTRRPSARRMMWRPEAMVKRST